MAKIKYDNTVNHANIGEIGYVYGQTTKKPISKKSKSVVKKSSKTKYDNTREHISIGKIGRVHGEITQPKNVEEEMQI